MGTRMKPTILGTTHSHIRTHSNKILDSIRVATLRNRQVFMHSKRPALLAMPHRHSIQPLVAMGPSRVVLSAMRPLQVHRAVTLLVLLDITHPCPLATERFEGSE